MKYTIAAALLLIVAAAWALDLGALFSGAARPVSAAELLQRAPAPATPSAAGEKPGSSGFPVEIAPDEAHYFIETKAPVVIDIRTAGEFAEVRLESVDMQLDYYAPDFKERLASLDRDRSYLLYCRSGRRTGAALGMMSGMGFPDIHHIKGGITAWIAAGLPVVR